MSVFFTTSCLLRGLRIRLDCELTHISMPGEKGSQPNRSSSTALTLLRNFTVSVLLILFGRFWIIYIRLRSSQTTLNVPLIRPIQSVDCITQTFWDILLIASGDWMNFSSWYWYCGILRPFNCWTVDRATFACWLSNSQLQSTVCNRAF